MWSHDLEDKLWKCKVGPILCPRAINPFSFVGGDPLNANDIDGNIAVYVNGIGGKDDPHFRNEICRTYGSDYCGDVANGEGAAMYSHDYFGDVFNMEQWSPDFYPIAFLGGGFGTIPGLQVYDGIYQAYWRKKRGEGLHVVAHSGGNLSSGVGVGLFNISEGFGSVTDRTTFSGADAGWVGNASSILTGTRKNSYYNKWDATSIYGAFWDFTNPVTAVIDPLHNLNAINPANWCETSSGILGIASDNHDPHAGCKTVNDSWRDDSPWWNPSDYRRMFENPASNSIGRELDLVYKYGNPINDAGNMFNTIFSSHISWNNKLNYFIGEPVEKTINGAGDIGKTLIQAAICPFCNW